MNNLIKKTPALASSRKQYGLSLIELMVALTLGLVLLGGFTTILMGSRQSYRVNDSMSRMQENARYAFQVMSQDIRMAGYFGCSNVDDLFLDNTLNYTQDATTEFRWSFEQSIEGYETKKGATAWEPTLISGTITSPLSGNDIIVVRGMESIDGGVTARVFEEPSAATLKIFEGGGLEIGDVVAASNCRGNVSIFQISDIVTVSGVESLIHTAGAGTPGNLTNSLRDEYFHTNDIITISKISTRAYYIRTNSNTPSAPALYQKSGSDNAQEIVEGVEEMQIQYGVDTDGDGSVDVYQAADVTMSNWANSIVSIRINLLMHTLEDNLASQPQTYTFNGETVLPTDRRLRQVYSTVIALRNRTLK